MAIKFKKSLNGTAPTYFPFPVADNQTIVENCLTVLTSNKVALAADAAAASTVLGVCVNAITTTTATAADIAYIDMNPASVYEMDYIGSATPVVGAKYDFGTSTSFDADDTSGGYIQVIGNIDTTAKKADVILNNRVFGVV